MQLARGSTRAGVLSSPVSVRAALGRNPRIIDDAAWAKLMAAGLTLNTEDLAEYGSPAAREAGSLQTGDAPGCGPWTCLHDEPVTADAGRGTVA
ncbi:hypothetical protein [Micromonospora sp. KC721]|uniref:hypothetical protein n=1 Tax=Micromonospora sp. KC721 TaxID=2530380 RepID=UPI0010453C03|nr:hypothetical protein [Micromonospora sp. KC721]TDB80417.1 hypothetical protein E1182_09080 [Micromonospora sp. KC721]